MRHSCYSCRLAQLARISLNVAFGFVRTKKRRGLKTVDVNNLPITREQKRICDAVIPSPLVLLPRLLTPHKSVELVAGTAFVLSVSCITGLNSRTDSKTIDRILGYLTACC